jgi:hypothetical protein
MPLLGAAISDNLRFNHQVKKHAARAPAQRFVRLIRFSAKALAGFSFLARINPLQHARLLPFKLLILLNIPFIEFNGEL